MILHTHAAPPFYKNGFLVGCDDTRQAVIIDPGDELPFLIRVAARERLDVRHILLTHAHLDHITGVAQAKLEFGAPIYLHPADLPLYDAIVTQGQMFGIRTMPQPPVDVFLDRHPVVTFGSYEARAHHTPGHCPGGVCLQIGRAGERGLDLFVGDTLFAGSIGRTDLPGGDLPTLLRSIREVLFPLGDDCRVYPGHGEPTTIGRERQSNPFLQED